MTGITVREALQVPALRDAVLVAGAAGLDRVITSVNIMEVPYIARFVKQDELLLTTTYPIREDPGVKESLVPTLAGRGLAALAIKPVDLWLPEIPSVMVKQAEDLAFPLIRLPANASFNEIINPILAEILNRQATILMRNEEVHRSLTHIVLNGGSLAEIAGMLAHLMQAPVSIHNARFRLLAFSGQAGGMRAETDAAGELARRFAQENPEQLEAAARGQTGPVSLSIDGQRMDVIVHPVTVAREIYAYLLVWEGVRSQRGGDGNVVEQAATVVALEIAKLRAVAEVDKRLRCSFVEDLMQGKIESRAEALTRAERYGWDLSAGFTPLLVEIDGFERLYLAHQEQHDITETLHRVWDVVSATVALHAPGSIAIDMSSRILVLVREPAPSHPRRASPGAAGLAARIRQDLGGSRPIDVSIGIGRHFDDIMDLREGFEQASRALSIGRVVNGPGFVTAFDDLGVYRILADSKNRAELERFAHDLLGPLIDADQRTNSELLRTLEVVLRCNGNLRLAARELFVHYNTLRYRVARIAEIAKTDLGSAEGRLNMQLALKILRMCDRSRPARRARTEPRAASRPPLRLVSPSQ